MHRSIALLALCLAACGMSSDKFDEKFDEKFCEEWEACNSDFSCNGTITDTTTVDTSDCEYDKEAAKACLDEAWTCNNDNTVFPFVEVPEACDRVYDCAATTTTETTTSGS